MKLLIFSDIHLHNWTYGSTILETGINSRLQDQQLIFKIIKERCKQRDIEMVVFCGDLFHTPGKLDPDVIKVASDGLYEIALITNEPPVVLVGNHDFKSKTGLLNSSSFLKNQGCMVVDPSDPYIFNNMGFFSYTDDEQVFERYTKYFQHLDYIFMHQGVKNTPVGSGFEIPNEFLSSEVVPSNSLCFTGHYHRHTKVADNLVIVGSPLQMTWSDSGDQKGYIILDTETKKWDFYNILSSPRFVKVKENSFTKAGVDGNFVRVSLLSRSMADKTEIRQKLLQLGARAVDFSDIEIGNESATTDPVVTSCSSFEEYCNEKSLREELISVGLEIQKKTYENIKHKNQ